MFSFAAIKRRSGGSAKDISMDRWIFLQGLSTLLNAINRGVRLERLYIWGQEFSVKTLRKTSASTLLHICSSISVHDRLKRDTVELKHDATCNLGNFSY